VIIFYLNFCKEFQKLAYRSYKRKGTTNVVDVGVGTEVNEVRISNDVTLTQVSNTEIVTHTPLKLETLLS
jgi:hypothetical protein